MKRLAKFLGPSRTILKEQVCLTSRFFSTNSYLKTSRIPISYVHGASERPLIANTLGQQLELTTALTPDRDAVVFTKIRRRFTYQQFLQEVDRVAASLSALGIGRGDRIAVWGPNTPEYILTQFACYRLGAICVMLNPAWRMQELQRALTITQACALVTPRKWRAQDYVGILRQIAPDVDAALVRRQPEPLALRALPHLRHLVLFGPPEPRADTPGVHSFEQLTSLATNARLQAIRDLQSKLDCDDPCKIIFTSGTTGMPKGATLTHFNLVNNARYMGSRMELERAPYAQIGEARARPGLALRDSEHPKLLVPLPIFHAAALAAVTLMCTNNVSIVLPDEGFSPDETLKAVVAERPNIVCGSAAIFVYLLRHPNLASFDLSSLHAGVMGAGPCPAPILRDIIQKLHCKHMVIAYGLTETSPMVFVGAPSDPEDLRVSTCGPIFDHLECKIVDKTGSVVPLGQPGEVCIRGHNVMLNYWNDDEATNEVIGADRYYHTGDIGMLDARGYLRIAGRLKDIIIRGGENINPLEVEQLLRQHPAVQDAQVVGVPSEQFGQEVCAFLILRPGVQKPSPLDIRHFVSGRLAAFKAPRHVLFVDAFPMTSTAKVQKFRLVEQAMHTLKIAAPVAAQT